MEKIIFVCPWAKDKKNSWSGTYLGLRENLQDHYEIIDVDSGVYHMSLCTILFRIKRLILKLKRIKSADMGLLKMKIMEPEVKRKLSLHDYPILQFDDCPGIIKGRKQYIYLDLHASYVEYLMDNKPSIFCYSAYQDIDPEYIRIRSKKQIQFLRECTGIFTMGEWLKNDLISNYNILPQKIIAVGGGSNIDVSKIDYSKKNGKRILFVGRDFERKNGWLVLDAFSIAKTIDKDIELYIAGPDTLDIEKDGVNVLGNISYEKLVEYYNLCDVFCMPSKFEAYGLVFGEALCFGLPCIGRDAYEMQYIIKDGENGYLLEKEEPGELANLMLKALKEKNIVENVRLNKEKYIEKYSWKSVCNRISNAIR